MQGGNIETLSCTLLYVCCSLFCIHVMLFAKFLNGFFLRIRSPASKSMEIREYIWDWQITVFWCLTWYFNFVVFIAFSFSLEFDSKFAESSSRVLGKVNKFNVLYIFHLAVQYIHLLIFLLTIYILVILAADAFKTTKSLMLVFRSPDDLDVRMWNALEFLCVPPPLNPNLWDFLILFRLSWQIFRGFTVCMSVYIEWAR